MTFFKRTALVAAITPLLTPVAWGLGLGDITMKSYLNEPLRAEVALLDVQNLTADDIRIRLATQEDFDRVGVDRAYFLTSVRFEVVVENGQGKILLSTEQPLLEPYMDFLIETRWPAGRLLREYTVLVDLPAKAQTVRVASSAKGPEEPGVARASEAVERDSAEAESSVRQLKQPESRPDRNYDRDASEQPGSGGRYLVQANDTLWEIARAASPRGASVEQTMVATVNMNGDAFTGGNINGLKAGYVLELPGEEDILTSRSEAIDEVALQNRDWANGVRRTRALRVVADNELPEETNDDAMAELDDSPVAAATDDSDSGLALNDADAEDAASMVDLDTADTSSGVVVPEDAPVAAVSNPELAEIQARLGQLSEQVGNLRQLVAVKDQQIAALQAEIAARDASDNQAPAPAPVAAAQPAPATSSDGLPWWIYALGGVVVVAIGGVIYARRADQRFQRALASAPATQRNPVARKDQGALAAQEEESDEPLQAAPSEDGERGYGKKLHNDYAEENAMSDAIAEADIYVAYGRYQQALTLLESVADSDEHNAAAYLKMLEIYIKVDRREEAESLIPRIEQTHDMAALKKAMAVLAAPVDKAEALDLGELADQAPAVSETQSLSDPDDDEADAPAAGLDFELVRSNNDEPSQELDLELDFSTDAKDAPELELSLETPVPAGDSAESDLSADLSSDLAADLSSDLSGGGTADWGDLSESVANDGKLPPELAAVLGTDVPPPAAEAEHDDDDALIYAAESNPMDAKLDLARAYIDMGDEDGARPVLEEVISKGDLQQQAEARELLIRID